MEIKGVELNHRNVEKKWGSNSNKIFVKIMIIKRKNITPLCQECEGLYYRKNRCTCGCVHIYVSIGGMVDVPMCVGGVWSMWGWGLQFPMDPM